MASLFLMGRSDVCRFGSCSLPTKVRVRIVLANLCLRVLLSNELLAFDH